MRSPRGDARARRRGSGLPGARPRLVDRRAPQGEHSRRLANAHPRLSRHGEGPVAGHDLSCLRILASTGEAWDPESWRWLFEKVGGKRCPIINLSGGTEVGACLLSALPITPLKPCSLVGPALGMAVDVFDAAGKPLRNGVGELVCTKPWPAMTRGIWGDPDRYMATYWSRWKDVWVHGDWASIDADGDWFLHGRSDDTLNVAGKRLGPAEIESILAEDEAVAESAAIGVPDDLKGEVIICFAVLKPGHEGGEALRAALRERVARRIGKSFAPGDVRFVAELPKTRSGKIVRRAIRSVVIGRDPGDLSSVENLAGARNDQARQEVKNRAKQRRPRRLGPAFSGSLYTGGIAADNDAGAAWFSFISNLGMPTLFCASCDFSARIAALRHRNEPNV